MGLDEVLKGWAERLRARPRGQLRLTRSLLEQMDSYPERVPLMVVSIEEVEAVLRGSNTESTNKETT